MGFYSFIDLYRIKRTFFPEFVLCHIQTTLTTLSSFDFEFKTGVPFPLWFLDVLLAHVR